MELEQGEDTVSYNTMSSFTNAMLFLTAPMLYVIRFTVFVQLQIPVLAFFKKIGYLYIT